MEGHKRYWTALSGVTKKTTVKAKVNIILGASFSHIWLVKLHAINGLIINSQPV